MATYCSSFHGQLKEIPGVYVDNFADKALLSRAFFLSHCHTDHTQGLFSADLQKLLKRFPEIRIFMSEHSAAIVRHNWSLSDELDKSIQILKLGTSDITLPARDNFKEEYVTVEVIPAGHCLGSVMYLFTTCQDKNILYTGDFRMSENDVRKFAQLHKDGDPIRIDVLYIDTTFIDPKYTYFPKRTDCMEELTIHLKKWLEQDANNRVSLSFSARYGYEYVIMELSNRLDMKIIVNENKWNLYRNMKFIESSVTNDENASRIHECCYTKDVTSHKRCGLSPDSGNEKFLLVRMSAMPWVNYKPLTSSVVFVNTQLNVCFPTHCSRSEIKAFVQYYSPGRIEGFPNPYNVEQSEVSFDERVTVTTPRKTPLKISSPRNSPHAKRNKRMDEKLDKDVARSLFL